MNTKKITQAVKTIISKQTPLSILETVCLSEQHLLVTDLETHLSIPFNSGINTCLPAEQFLTALNIINNPTFKATKHTDTNNKITFQVEISSPQSQRKIDLLGQDPDNYPLSPIQIKDSPDFFHVGEIDATELEYLEEALQFISKDPLRPAMTGVYISSEIVATDAQRLYWRPLKNMNQNFIISKKTIKTMLVFGGSWQVYYGIKYNKEEIISQYGALLNDQGVLITFLPIDARFPDYKCVFPKNNHLASLQIPPAILRKELANAAKFTTDPNNTGILSLNGNAKLFAENIDDNQRYEVIFNEHEIKYQGELTIGFNMKFLDEIAAQFKKNETIEFKFWTSDKCTIINNRYLLMPLMLNN